MATKEKIGKHVYWRDGEGLLVPLKHVSKEDQARDALVEELVAEAEQLNATIAESKARMAGKIQEYLNAVAARYGEEWQGNARIRNFSQDKEVEVSQCKLLAFDETLRVAEVKVKECVKKWSSGSRSEIVALVNQAFRPNQKDQLEVKTLMGLTTLEIDDPAWNEAMETIKNSVTVQSTKQYLNFRTRDEAGVWRSISLNFSAVRP